MTEKKQCSEDVFERYWDHPCSKLAVIERDGAWYCKIHDPEYIKVKRAKEEAAYQVRSEESNRKWARAEALTKATDGLTTEELLRVTPELIRRALQPESAGR